jgi:putative (di)nucleoside polyphosphate hydrolase
MSEPVIEPSDEDVARATDQGAGAYRPGVGIMLVNRDGRVFVGQRFDSVVEAWQMPQGGIDKGEEPWDAALRELGEETGVPAHLVERIGETEGWLRYDLPEELRRVLWKGRYRGQRQKWYALRFLGTDDDVNIATHEPEFRDWKWAGLDELANLIVPFKRELYAALIAELRPVIGAAD